jgi:DNA-binding response OmpR family regulator
MNASPASHPDTPLAGQRLVIVEDEYIQYMALAEVLSDAGAEVVGFAETVSAALEMVEAKLSDGGINLALLDLNLSSQRVLPVADRLAASGVPFVFLTGYGDRSHIGLHHRAPVIEKPYDYDALIATIEMVLARQAAPLLATG